MGLLLRGRRGRTDGVDDLGRGADGSLRVHARVAMDEADLGARDLARGVQEVTGNHGHSPGDEHREAVLWLGRDRRRTVDR